MAEILKEWLTERLQKPIEWEPKAFGDLMKNGFMIAGVLLSYHIINDDEYFVIRSGNMYEDIKNNWNYISGWLTRIDINLSPIECEKMMDGKGSSLLRLFYRLFLHLDKRDRTNFIKQERKMTSALIDKLGHRFQVDNIPEPEPSFVDSLSKPLLNEKHFIDWQRKKVKQVKDTYDYIRHKYSKIVENIEEKNTPFQSLPTRPTHLTSKEKKDMAQFALRHPGKFENFTYQQLLEMEQTAKEKKSPITDANWAQCYMENLHSKIHKRTDSEEFQKRLGNTISGSLWDMSIHEEESKLDTELAKKVMKLSQFEKQMCTQILETKQQARNLYKNRIHAEKEFTEQRIHQFNQFLDNVKEEIQLELVEIDFEKNRQDVLHKTLYAEKMKRKRKHYYEICYETLESIVDFASKIAHFHMLKMADIPDHFIHEWKNLYYKMQPIFDILDPMEDILKEYGEEEELIPEAEEIVRLELDRQEALSDEEFLEYHNYKYPWCLNLLLPNYDGNSEERKYEYLGKRILGHVVYTLLEAKYPYPPPRPPANLPTYIAKALVRGLPDRSITVPMQILLNASKIHVVRLEKAINYCLRHFKSELVGCTDIELSFDKFTALAPDEEDKELIKLMKLEDDNSYKTSDLAVAAMLGVIAANTKQTQTPKTIPEEEIVLSSAAELGRYTYEALYAGESLTDYLLSAMIVEYLQDQNDIRGFVLINYPNSYRQAQVLEETFLGIAPPDDTDLDDRDDIYLEESIIKHRKIEKDQHKAVRISKLVSDPHKKRIVKPFESYFTCYINLKPTEDILQEIFIWDLTLENSELIDRFYAIMGLNYSMYYEVVDKDLLALICKYVIGDFITPLKSAHLLFGENVLSSLDFPSADDKKIKSKLVKAEVSSTIKSGEKLPVASKISKTSSDEIDAIKESSIDDLPDDTIFIMEEKSIVSVEEVQVLAGEEDWEYGELPIYESIGIALANCWEEIEKAYINDMTQLFFAKRLQMNCVVPYTKYIKDKMEQIITLPSNKQDLVSAFQKSYNDFENDWRDVTLTKNEWHCRAKELQNRLYMICDERKANAIRQRQRLIMDNWAMEELTSMANIYIGCMQAELNRCILTFQTFHDFYYAMIKRMPSTDRLSSKELVKIFRDLDDLSGSRKSADDKCYRKLKTDFQELQLKNIEIDYSNNPFNFVIENNVKLALKIIKDTNDSYRSLLVKEYGEVVKVQTPIRKKEEGSEVIVSPEEIYKQNALKCIEEWTMGINGEMFRVSLRMQALQYKCYRDMKLFNDNIYKAFMQIENDINTYYLNEITSVDRLCKYIQMAVENGRRIPENLVLDHDTFTIDPNLLHYSPSETPVDTGVVKEIPHPTDFKIKELASLRTQFKIVAPTGIILHQAFIYLLQDFIFFGKESCDGGLFPESWRSINPEQTPKLVYLLFGDSVFVDWRDFLILCLNLRYPTVEEMIESRNKLRCKDLESKELISRDDFIKQDLWYESDFDPNSRYACLRKNLVKHFLFELYETETNVTNYSALLLAFCKSPDPVEGFSTALSMAVGKKVCYLLEECEEVVCKLIKDKQYKDACLACAMECTRQFLDTVLTKVVDYCEGFTVAEIKYEPPVDDKKGKKGKATKKTESTQSARAAKTPKRLSTDKSKTSQSAVNVKTTYICPPCQDDTPVKEEKVVEKVEEEESPEIEPDPNVCYAVSQAVIWNVLRTCLPWHFVLLQEIKTSPYVERLNKIFRRLEVDTDNGDIYICKFVADPNVCHILNKVKKFTSVSIADEINKVSSTSS